MTSICRGMRGVYTRASVRSSSRTCVCQYLSSTVANRCACGSAAYSMHPNQQAIRTIRYQAARRFQEEAGTSTMSADTSAAAPFPLSLESSSPSIGVGKLSSYLSLLPRAAINEDYLNQRAAVVEEKVAEELIEHKPLRTQLKSDMRLALRSMDPHTSLRSLPFSLSSYKLVLGAPFQFQSNEPASIVTNTTTAASTSSSSLSASTSAARKLSPSSLSAIVEQLTNSSTSATAAQSLLQYLDGGQKGVLLQIINELSMRHAYESLLTVFSAVMEPHAERMIAQMSEMTNSNQTPAQVLSFLRSLHTTPLVDRSAGLALSASLSVRQSSVSRRILSLLTRYQSGQARLFERYRWEFSLEVAKGGEKQNDNASSTPDQSDELNAYNPQPYLSFLSTLMKASSGAASSTAEKYFRRARQLSSQEVEKLATARRVRRKARRSARSSPAATLPQVKPALQLFNRLVDPPAGAGAFPVLPWNRIAQDMLHGVGKVCANEAGAMLTQGSHAEILRAASEPLQQSLTQQKQDPLDKYSLNDIAATLNEIASRKQEALDLVAGISFHVLQSFTANRTMKVDQDAASTPTSTQSSPSASAETEGSESNPAEDANSNPEIDPTISVNIPIQSIPVISPTTAASNHHMWRLVKLFLGSSQSSAASASDLQNITPSQSFSSSHPAIGASYTKFAESASSSLAQVLNQRMHIRRALTDVFPAAFSADMFRVALTETQQKRLDFDQQQSREDATNDLSARSSSDRNVKFSHTPASARAAQELVDLSQLHLRLLHTVLEAYIRLAKDFAPLEAAGEKLRVRAEYRILAEESALAAAEAREAETGTDEEDASASHIASHEAIAAVRHAAYPATTLGPVQTLLAYAANECIQFTPHTLTLLFHKGLFGGGIRSSVRYQSTSHPVAAAASAGESKFHGSEEADLRVAFRILDSCGPSFRRIPSKSGGANSDVLSSILIDHLLPKPFTLHDTVAASNSNSSIRQPHNKLFECFSSAILNVLEKQRRRLSREEGFQRKQAALQKESADLYSTDNVAKSANNTSALAGLAARFPFSLVRDQSGLLSRLLSEMEFLHSRPEWKALDTQAYLNSGIQSPKLRSQFLTRIGKGSGAPIPNESARASVQQKAESYASLARMQTDTVLRGVNNAFNQKEVASWRERDHSFFGKHTSPYAFYASYPSNIESPLQQTPSYVISKNVYSSLLAYYDRCNNLPAAMVLLDRMRHSWSTPSLMGAGAMLNLSLKYMNYELVGSVMSEYVLSLADSSSKKRRVWRQLLEGMSRFNSYSNVDSYMKYLHHLVRNYLEPTLNDTKQINAGSNHEQESALTAAAVKSDMDALWTAWVARGGAAEVLRAWEAILKQKQSSAKLDDASITAFLNGLVRSSKSGFDATQPLQSDQILTSVESLLRFIATANQPSLNFTTAHKGLLSLHIPIFLAQLRGVSRGDAVVDSIDGGSASFFTFCSENNISVAVARAVLDNGSEHVADDDLSSETSKDLSTLTPSGLRAHVVSSHLSEFNASVGSAGIDHAISKLEKILAK